MEPWVRMGRAVGDQPGPWMIRVEFGGAGLMRAARSLGAEMVRSNRRANVNMRSAVCCRPAKVEERERKSSAYPMSETEA